MMSNPNKAARVTAKASCVSRRHYSDAHNITMYSHCNSALSLMDDDDAIKAADKYTCISAIIFNEPVY